MQTFCSERRLNFILFGDSITQRSFDIGGWGSRLYDKYCRKSDVLNRGYSGYNTRWCKDLVDDVIENFKSEPLNIITIWLGANDAVQLSSGKKQFVPIDEYRDNLNFIISKLLKAAKDKGVSIKVIVFTPPPVNEEMKIQAQLKQWGKQALPMSQRSLENTRQYAQAVCELVEQNYAQNEDVLLLELFNSIMREENWKNKVFNDGLHLSEEGNKIVFEKLIELIETKLPDISFDKIPYQFPWHHEMSTFGGALVPSVSNEYYKHDIIVMTGAYVWNWEESKFSIGNVAINQSLKQFIDANFVLTHKDKYENLKIQDYSRKVILPGLVDAHMHIELLGKSLNNLSLNNCKSIDDLEQNLKDFCEKDEVKSHKRSIIGFGWDHEKFTSRKQLPTKELLDRICPDKPVLLYRICVHIACANTKALEIAQADMHHKNGVDGGSFDIDENGNLTGIVRENAAKVVYEALEEYDKSVADMSKVRESNIVKALNYSLSQGLTTVNTNDRYTFDIYKKLDDEGALPIRVNLVTDNMEVMDRKPYISQSNYFKNTRVKFFSDGSLGSETAAIKAKSGKEYQGFGGKKCYYKGMLLYDDKTLREGFKRADENDYQLEVHCIGDAASEQVLQAMEDILGTTSRRKRPQITHCQIVSPEIIQKMSQLGVIGNLQPSFVPTDVNFLETRLENDTAFFGYDRMEYSYCWKKLVNGGVLVTGSSDAPVESVDPLKGIFDIMMRPRDHCFETEVEIDKIDSFLPDEKLHFSQALNLYTTSAHFGSFDEMTRGRIEPGYFADLTILTIADPTDIEDFRYAKMLKSASIEEVWVNGYEKFKSIKFMFPKKRKLGSINCC